MQTVIRTRIYDYETELDVELIGEDDRGEVALVSYQFAVGADSRLDPDGDIEPARRDSVVAALTKTDYEVR